MCKHWGLHISTNINLLGGFLGSFWAVWRGLLWCLKVKLILWQFLRYWWFNKWYHGGYQLICLISRPILIASRHDWYRLKGLFKGFPSPLRLWESMKNWWRYGRMKFVIYSTFLLIKWLPTFSPKPSLVRHSKDFMRLLELSRSLIEWEYWRLQFETSFGKFVAEWHPCYGMTSSCLGNSICRCYAI